MPDFQQHPPTQQVYLVMNGFRGSKIKDYQFRTKSISLGRTEKASRHDLPPPRVTRHTGSTALNTDAGHAGDGLGRARRDGVRRQLVLEAPKHMDLANHLSHKLKIHSFSSSCHLIGCW